MYDENRTTYHEIITELYTSYLTADSNKATVLNSHVGPTYQPHTSPIPY